MFYPHKIIVLYLLNVLEKSYLCSKTWHNIINSSAMYILKIHSMICTVSDNFILGQSIITCNLIPMEIVRQKIISTLWIG